MRILVWHGWHLGGTGSSVYTARIVETWRGQGHDVLLMCQEPHPEDYPFLDGWGSTGDLPALSAEPAKGRAVLLRPEIGDLLPVFVLDEYEGFRVRRFVDLADEELDAYLDANVAALRAAAAWHRSELAIAGHALPGPVVVRRALGTLPFVAKVHGSDIEYAMRAQSRYVELAREGLEGAVAVTGSSHDAIDRLVELVPSVADRVRVVPPGVDVRHFRPTDRREALLHAAELLESEPARANGRTTGINRAMAEAMARRDAEALGRLAGYDQTAPDVGAPEALRSLARHQGPLVGYLGKLIPQKGVDHLIAALALLDPRPRALIVGFGTFREWLQALVATLDAGDAEAVRFLRDRSPMRVDLTEDEVIGARGLAEQVMFTGRLDHRYAGRTVAALDILVVPSTLEEGFGMVALEGAAAGALPLVAHHSGLAEIARDLEAEIGRPRLLSYEPGPQATRNLARGLERLLALPRSDRRRLGQRLAPFVAERWSWKRTAEALLKAGGTRTERVRGIEPP